jgi:ABC-type metal ion transport system substrate-binding protein
MICYNDPTMLHPTPIDISANPELLRIAEEVAATKTPRELKRDNQTVAVIMPARTLPAKKAREKTRADYEAFKSAAGGWKDVDTDKLLTDIYADRKRSNSRPPIKL